MLIVFHLASVSDQIKPFFHSSKIIAKPLENNNGLKHAIRDFCVELGNQKHQQADAFCIPTSWTQFLAHVKPQVVPQEDHMLLLMEGYYCNSNAKKESISYLTPPF